MDMSPLFPEDFRRDDVERLRALANDSRPYTANPYSGKPMEETLRDLAAVVVELWDAHANAMASKED